MSCIVETQYLASPNRASATFIFLDTIQQKYIESLRDARYCVSTSRGWLYMMVVWMAVALFFFLNAEDAEELSAHCPAHFGGF